ncbi:hypothetical protein SSCG_04049 [Streptomyces clavuligerus]|nr:hypothetical protein SSCG_04049 [Streptomyces clavuligerus]
MGLAPDEEVDRDEGGQTKNGQHPRGSRNVHCASGFVRLLISVVAAGGLFHPSGPCRSGRRPGTHRRSVLTGTSQAGNTPLRSEERTGAAKRR